MVNIKYKPQSGEGKSSSSSDREEHRTMGKGKERENSCKYNAEIVQKIIDNLDIIKQTIDSYGEIASHRSLSELMDKVKEIDEVVNNLNVNLSTTDTLTGAHSKIYDKISGLMGSIEDLMRGINVTNNNANASLTRIDKTLVALKEQIKSVKDVTTTAQTKLEYSHSVGASGNSVDINNIEQRVKEEVEKLTPKIDEIKNEVAALPHDASRVETTPANFEMKTEHKTYFTWTAVFAIALVLSAIFITRGYLVDFSNPAYLTSVLIIFCISFLATSVFNLVFAIANVDLYMEDATRLAYFIVCGIFDIGTLVLSVIVLAIR